MQFLLTTVILTVRDNHYYYYVIDRVLHSVTVCSVQEVLISAVQKGLVEAEAYK
jgi:uncharacterized membrane protein YvlD (DUF360 family)